MAEIDPTRTRVLRDEFARALRRLPEAAKREILRRFEFSTLDEQFVEEAVEIIAREVGEDRARRVIREFLRQAYVRGALFATRQLKRFGIEIVIPQDISVVDEQTVQVLENLSLDLVKGLSEDMKKRIAFEIRDGLLRGESVRDIARRIRDAANIEKHRANMIARTETIRAFNAAAERRYRMAGVRKFKFVAALDERTCHRCGRYDGKVYELDDPTAPKPPLHPQCRCSIAPVVK